MQITVFQTTIFYFEGSFLFMFRLLKKKKNVSKNKPITV